MATRIFITGGTGFLGSHLARRLVRKGFEIHLFVRQASSCWRIEDLKDRVSFWTGDVTNGNTLRKSVKEARPEIVFHLAGNTSFRHFKDISNVLTQSATTNLLGTLNLFEAVLEAKVGRVIHVGGLEEYGNGPIPYREDQRESPISPYSSSQVAASHFGEMAQRSLGLPLVILRPALAYGPAQSTDFFIPSLIKQCLVNETFEMTDGEQTRDLIYVDDVVDAFVKAATAGEVDGEVVNISTGKEHTMAEVAERILRLTGSTIKIQKNPQQRRRSEINRLVASNEKAKRLFNWVPRTDLEDGLKKTIAWFRNR